jgi:hypothetical protein
MASPTKKRTHPERTERGGDRDRLYLILLSSGSRWLRGHPGLDTGIVTWSECPLLALSGLKIEACARKQLGRYQERQYEKQHQPAEHDDLLNAAAIEFE